MFGEVTFQRRLYDDRKTGQIVYLLNQYLSIEEREPISLHRDEWAIYLTAEGTSYRKAANLLKEWFGKPIFLTNQTAKADRTRNRPPKKKLL
ncbi:UPF0236 family transposase-like protein [Thermicanus aegyptius]|uniref:UPF0236 family transposase-like protein n=1 Tax=Thermicanus aegyptius TaxID=94009 RepID=UPI0009FE38BC